MVDEASASASANAAVVEDPGDSDGQAGAVDAASQCEETETGSSLLVSSSELNVAAAAAAVDVNFATSGATVTESAATAEPVSAATVMDDCQRQNGSVGHCIQPTDSVSEARSMIGCNRATAAGDDDADRPVRAASAAANADAELVEVSGGFVQAPGDELASDAAARIDEPAAAAMMPANEPQQPAAAAAAVDAPAAAAAAPAAAEVANQEELVGNIIPAPLAVLAPQGLGDVHQAMMQGGGPVGFQPYKHPNLFALRVNVSVYLLQHITKVSLLFCCVIQNVTLLHWS